MCNNSSIKTASLSSLRLVALCLFLLTLVVGVSCAHNRTLTREEWLQATQKTYSNTTKDELIKNAEQVLTLSDRSDFIFSHTRNGFTGNRRWVMYLVIAAEAGTDHWIFEAIEKDGKLLATVQASSSAGSVIAGANSGSALTTPTMVGNAIQGTAVYRVFWDRLDYLMGLRTTWPDCNDARVRIKNQEMWGPVESICGGFTVTDEAPPNLSDAEIERVFKNRTEARLNYLKKYHPDKWNVEWKKAPRIRN